MDTKHIEIGGYHLKNLNKINVILGKNGCGKSIMLRNIENAMSGQTESFGKSTYITPERGGNLVYNAGIAHDMSNTKYLQRERGKNQSSNFRTQSVALYNRLETSVLREISEDLDKRKDFNYTFKLYIKKINKLLDNIKIEEHKEAFKIYLKTNDTELKAELKAEEISSGESELISLGIECLFYSRECINGKENFLLLDEPDVHLHPDLQVRLMDFLNDLVTETSFTVLIATHSTAILGALELFSNTHIAFMSFDQKDIEFKAISDVYKKILPVFGAHPLSNIFNLAPIVLVEGDDDERIWQQAVRSSNGKIKIYPCSVGGKDDLSPYEQEVQTIIQAVYNDAKAYSLRDRDGNDDEIDDMPPIIRMKLYCRTAENLLLSDEVLDSLGVTWNEVINRIEKWIKENQEHPHYATMQRFQVEGYQRDSYDIKEIRNDLMGIIGSNKPWEVAVGQAISNLSWNESSNFNEDGKLLTFLGKKVVENLLPETQAQL